MDDKIKIAEYNRLINSKRCNNYDELREVLDNTGRVYLWGGQKDVHIMKRYLQRGCENCNIVETLINANPVGICKKDIVFICTLDVQEFIRRAKFLVDEYGCSLYQIIPPSCFFVKALAEYKGVVLDFDLGQSQLPFLATIDIVDTCNLSCRTCMQEAFSHSSGKMDFDLFLRILDKLQLMNIKQVELYNYTEPFLHPDVYDFMKEVKRRNLTLGISTNLSLKTIPNLEKCVDLLQPGDWFVVTISGITKNVYDINHAGGNIDHVINNLKIISRSSQKNMVTLRLLHFDYNEGELFRVAELANQLGISFQWFDANGNPFGDNEEKRRIQAMVQDGVSLNAIGTQFGEDLPYCRFIHCRNIVIDYLGNVEQCCLRVVRPYNLGSFLEQDISVIQFKREISPVCYQCSGRYELKEKEFPVDYGKIKALINNAVNTSGVIKEVSPVSVYSNLQSNSDYLKKVKQYYVQMILQNDVR